MSRVRTIIIFLCVLAVPGLASAQSQPTSTGSGQAWPTKPLRFVVSWPAGGSADAVGRLVAERLSKNLGQPIVVDNRSGASGTIGTTAVVRAEPDGYTLLFAAPSELSVAPVTIKSLPYDPVKDLQPITQVMRGPYLLVAHPSFPPNTMSELIAYVKANPGKINYSSFGTGTLNHLYGEMLKSKTGINALHVPYKGSTPALNDLLGGQVQYTFDNMGVVLPQVKAGKLKAIAVMAPQRVAQAPNVPTMAEAGVDMGSGTWLGLLAPAKTPKHIVERLHAETLAVLNAPEMRKAFEERSIVPVGSRPEEFGRLIQTEATQWRQLAAQIGLKPE